jgi:hypothetical protein
MKYLKRFENLEEDTILLTEDIIEFGEHLYNFIKEVIDDNIYDIKTEIINKSYSFDKKYNIEKFEININNKKNFKSTYIFLNLTKYVNGDTFMRYHLNTILSREKDIIEDIDSFLQYVYQKHIRNHIKEVINLHIKDLKYFMKEINKDNFELFVQQNKYNL